MQTAAAFCPFLTLTTRRGMPGRTSGIALVFGLLSNVKSHRLPLPSTCTDVDDKAAQHRAHVPAAASRARRFAAFHSTIAERFVTSLPQHSRATTTGYGCALALPRLHPGTWRLKIHHAHTDVSRRPRQLEKRAATNNQTTRGVQFTTHFMCTRYN